MENWKDIIGYESYYSVSNLGNIRRDMKSSGTKAGRIIKPSSHGRKYLYVSLSKNNVVKNKFIHHIVAEAFIGNRDKGFHVNHKDGIKYNNKSDNLEYVSPRENTIHYYQNIGNKCPKGENHYQSKLNKNDVISIRNEYSRYKNTYQRIADKYNVCASCIREIIIKKTWKHI